MATPGLPVGGPQPLGLPRGPEPCQPPGSGFREVLERHRAGDAAPELELRLTRHALEQIQARKLVLTRADLSEIQKLAARASAKGGREALLLYKDLALIANLPNQVVKTVIDRDRLQEHVFTNIDCAVVHPGRTSGHQPDPG